MYIVRALCDTPLVQIVCLQVRFVVLLPHRKCVKPYWCICNVKWGMLYKGNIMVPKRLWHIFVENSNF
jgi:hypothetical protein